MPQIYSRFELPGDAEMRVEFEANFNAIAEERGRRCAMLLWSIAVICAFHVAFLVVSALYFSYLVVVFVDLMGLYLYSNVEWQHTRDATEASDANQLAYRHALVFCIITAEVVKCFLAMASSAIEVLLFTYRFWKIAWQGRQEPEVEGEVQAGEAEAEVCLHVGAYYSAFLVAVSAFVWTEYVRGHEAPDAMKLAVGSALVLWIIASGIVIIPLIVAWHAIDALCVAYDMWVILWQGNPDFVILDSGDMTGSAYRYRYFLYIPGFQPAWQRREEAAAEVEVEAEADGEIGVVAEVEVAAEVEVLARRAEAVVGEVVLVPDTEVRVQEVEPGEPPRRERHSGIWEDIEVVLVQLRDWNIFVRELEFFPRIFD